MIKMDKAFLHDDTAALLERKRLLDDVWLLTFFVLLLATGAPWFLRILEINIAPLTWSIFAYGSTYLAVSWASGSLRDRRHLLFLTGAAQATGVLFLGFLWHLTGTLQNPMFLLAFVLPVIAGGLVLMSWQTYAVALLSIITVLTVSMIDTPELRWYLLQTGLAPGWLIHLLPESSVGSAQPFAGLNTPPSYLFVLLLLFAVLLFTAALMTEALTSFLRRLYGRLALSANAVTEAESLSLEILRASPSPVVLVYADTFKVVQASQSFLNQLLLSPEDLLEKNLFALVAFSYPEVVEELIAGKGGEVPATVYRVGGETRVAKVRVYHMEHRGARCAYVNIQDLTDLHLLQAAFNVVDEALVIISSARQVLYCNQAAQRLFGLQPGIDATIALQQANLPPGWWELGARRHQIRRLQWKGKPYQAACFATEITGERDVLTVLSVRSAGEE